MYILISLEQLEMYDQMKVSFTLKVIIVLSDQPFLQLIFGKPHFSLCRNLELFSFSFEFFA